MICRGHSEAKNKFLKSNDPSKPSTNIMYLDANNLFGHSKIQLLPTEMFDWVIPKHFNLQSQTKYLEQNGVIQQKRTGKEKFGIRFCVFINCYWQSLSS